MRDISQFKILDIKSDCFDILIASFVAWLKGEFGFLYNKCLGFTYEPEHKRIGDRMCIHKGDIVEEAFNNGVKVDFYENITKSELLMLVREVNPLILEVDGYNCAWRSTYQKIHKLHEILILDYEDKTGQLICMDIFPIDYNLKLDMEFVLKNATRIISLSGDSKKYKLLEPEDYLTSVVSNLCPTCAPSSTQHLYAFTYDLPDVIDLEHELEGFEDVDIIYCPIVWNFKSITWSYYQFIYLLNFISTVEMKKFINITKRIMENFELITNQIIFKIIKHEYLFSTVSIKKHLWKTVCEEELLIKNLMSYCNHKCKGHEGPDFSDY